MSEARSLRDVLAEQGATDQQLGSKVFLMIEKALADGAVSEYETCMDAVRRLKSNADKAMGDVGKAYQAYSNVKDSFHALDVLYQDVLDKLREIDVAASQQVITDEKAKNALLVYRGVLDTTADVFGKERMTDAVMAAAIEAGSYAMWRTVMGGKFPENDQEQQRPRKGRVVV